MASRNGQGGNSVGGNSFQAKLAQELQIALTHHRAGRIGRAESIYRRLLDKAPDHPDVLHLLGVIATSRGQHQRAIQLIDKALRSSPDFPDAHVSRGNALRLAGRPDEAIASYRHAIALKPDAAAPHSNLARLLNDLRQFEPAVECCRTAIRLDPLLAAARVNLAVALQGMGRLPEAATAWRDAIDAEPGRAESYHAMALLLRDMERIDGALSSHDQATARQPDNAVFHCERGATLIRAQNGEAAVESYRRAAALVPDLLQAWVGLRWALRLVGRFEEADACVERIRSIDPSHVDAYGSASIVATDEANAEFRHLADTLARPGSSAQECIAAGFGLGRLLDAAGRYDDAFARYREANALVRRNWPSGADRFDADVFARWADLLIETYTPEYFANAADAGSNADLPVFIVGMPRSGTTLVEQICASHSRVVGAGELHDIDRIATSLAGGRGDGRVIAHAGDDATARHLADEHVRRLRHLGGDAVRVVDKMPDNILQVGLIATLFPGARIICCDRDGRDIALSCYFQLFAPGLMHFSYDLTDCARRCRDVARLATHWGRVLAPRIMQVRYETLVGDLEGESRRLIAFLGLDWEPACLEFHRTERTVTTASHWQVRQPLYKSSVERWRNYERHLGPLSL